MGRRGENIRKRIDGRWEARIVQGKPIAGCTNYKYLYGKSYQEVRKKKKEFLISCQSQILPVNAASSLLQFQAVQPSLRDDGQAESLFRNVIEEWLHSKQPIVKESTLACYTVLVREHILPTLGDLPLNKIDSAVLGKFLVETKTHGRIRGEGELSDKTVSDVKVILMQILTFAKNRGMLTTVPECPSVSSRRPDVSVLTELEQKRVEKEALKEDTPFSLGVLVSLYSGMRIGEVCGLQWKDFDCKNGTINISKTVSRITVTDNQAVARTKVVIGTPKTDCSTRTIPLPTTVFQYFMQHRRSGDCYLVTGTQKYMEPRVCLDRYKRFLNRAGVSDHTFHTLRHTFATRCVECGVDVKSLSEIMGHSDVRITMQRYVHPSMDSKKAQVNKLSCFQISGQNSGQVHPTSA